MNLRNELIKALKTEKEGNWDLAHQIVQQYSNEMACWIHAYLHRKEGDKGNAGYWYSRASKTFPSYSLEEEWEIIFVAISNSD